MVSADTVKSYVNQNFHNFGVNRKREVVRLLFEISKREHCSVDDIVKGYRKPPGNFLDFKKYLLQRRFPAVSKKKHSVQHVLPELSILPGHRVKISRKELILKDVYIEEAVIESAFVKRLKRNYPSARFTTIPRYREYVGKQNFSIEDYNNRLASFYIVKEEFDFFKRCPCSNKSVSCGLHVVNLGSGCAFECSYCYLQDYINSKGIILPANIEDFFYHFEQYKQDIVIGSGEITDSLVFDHITEYSPRIVNFFKKYPKSTFEFKTKSDNIDLLLTAEPAGNIVVGWSVNPQAVIESTEFYTASLEKRLAAAKKCIEAGYKVAFHFDPIIYYAGWEKDYQDLVNRIFDVIPDDKIQVLSLGTLRMTPRLKKIIENRFPENTILNEEFVMSYDGKLRYSEQVRSRMYTKVIEWIRRRSPSVRFYLCMEEKSVCGDCHAPPLKQFTLLKEGLC